MKRRCLTTAICLGAIVFLLLITGCGEKRVTSPDEEEEPARSFWADYFPLVHGDWWTWEVVSYPVQEKFVDGDSSLGEPFTDLNEDRMWNWGEPYEDVNANGGYDHPGDPWTPGMPYIDRNANGEYDQSNGVWEEDELFLDLDGNGICSEADTLTFCASILYPYPEDQLVTRGGQFVGTYSDGEPGGMWGDVDKYSNDSLGLRWHGHQDRTLSGDFIAGFCYPIAIARDSVTLGDSLTSTCFMLPGVTWVSVFEGVEEVTVPAGTFPDCLKFRSVASDWIFGMARYNGTSYQWYAKDVGLVKSEGPGDGEHWILKSASVGGTDYP
jgi:hypothetical protein